MPILRVNFQAVLKSCGDEFQINGFRFYRIEGMHTDLDLAANQECYITA